MARRRTVGFIFGAHLVELALTTGIGGVDSLLNILYLTSNFHDAAVVGKGVGDLILPLLIAGDNQCLQIFDPISS